VFAANTTTGTTAIGMQASGKAIVAGTCLPNPGEDMCISRLRVDGTQLDSRFGSGGTSQIVLAGQDYARSLAIDATD
jgi:hypothetical protein